MASSVTSMYLIALLAAFPCAVVSVRQQAVDVDALGSAYQSEAVEAYAANLVQSKEAVEAEYAADLIKSKGTSNTTGETVFAMVYDLDKSRTIAVVNTLLFLGGVYHVGIMAFGEEWMYGGGSGHGTGIGKMMTPGQHPHHKFYDKVELGSTSLSHHQFKSIVRSMAESDEWLSEDYALLSKNCISFSEALANALPERLSLPYWMKSLMNVGATILPPVGAALGTLSTVSESVSEAGVVVVQQSKAASAAASELSQQAKARVITNDAYAVCSSQFAGVCGLIHVGGLRYSVACPAGHCCTQYQSVQAPRCVPWCPGNSPQLDGLFSNNANGACR